MSFRWESFAHCVCRQVLALSLSPVAVIRSVYRDNTRVHAQDQPEEQQNCYRLRFLYMYILEQKVRVRACTHDDETAGPRTESARETTTRQQNNNAAGPALSARACAANQTTTTATQRAGEERECVIARPRALFSRRLRRTGGGREERVRNAHE